LVSESRNEPAILGYPLSGLVGSDADRAATQTHNAQYPNYAQNVQLLCQNVVAWLNASIVVDGKTILTGVKHKYITCLEAPNYTVFSNTTSAQQWNTNLADSAPSVVPLESPHNDIHLSVGGFDIPGADFSPIDGANADMGENDTAGLDPIFFFHHCFVDRVFWLWQKKHGFTDHLEVIAEYPGTNSADSQGPTPGTVPNSWLTLDSPLNPFKQKDGKAYTSLDCINIEKQLGYTYGPGSLEEPAERLAAVALEPRHSTKKIRVSGLNRAAIRGSFLVSAFVTIEGKRYRVGTESVLSRWSVQGCANCQTHLEVQAFMDLRPFQEAALKSASCQVEVRTRDGMLGQVQHSALAMVQRKLFRVEVR
jgi:tyrosinase